ncbi:sodium:solute symporter family protein [Oscillibacter sp. MSJ-2]|uniref:Sodium:solute symporter family protein n=1 Tax=Dysosmobacter acutus TaxID=2841504 RepID=A0ABS6F9Z1_9FIRM|nr:sodium:solute symporter family protein [Dysosmobacter acutus]MBU5627113.1 sodium:solute symporter family protein [Dysosmobacter acutus]
MDGKSIIIGVFIVYLIAMLYIGWWGMKKSQGAEGYYVANRRCGKWLSVGTFSGSFISAVAVIGYVGNGYAKGYMTLVNVLGCVFSFYLIYFLFINPIKKRFDHLYTVPELFENMYESKSMMVISSVITVGLFTATLVSQIKGGSLICSTILGIDYNTALLIITTVFILYTVMGGMYSVVYTDLIQTGILVIGIVLAAPFALKLVGGFSAMQTAIAQVNPSAMDPITVAGGPWGVISTFLSFSLGIAATQYYLIRVYSAKDVKTARFMVSASCAIWTVIGIILVLLGICARILLPDLAAADNAVIALAYELPTVVRMLLLIGIACAIMSTTDTILLAAGTYVGRDLYPLVRKGVSESQSVKVTKIAVVVIGLLAGFLALNPPELIIQLTTFTTSVTAATFFGPMVLGFYWPRTTREGALSGMVGGGIAAVMWQLYNTTAIPPAAAAVVISFALTIFVSLAGPKTHLVKLSPEKNG